MSEKLEQLPISVFLNTASSDKIGAFLRMLEEQNDDHKFTEIIESIYRVIQ